MCVYTATVSHVIGTSSLLIVWVCLKSCCLTADLIFCCADGVHAVFSVLPNSATCIVHAPMVSAEAVVQLNERLLGDDESKDLEIEMSDGLLRAHSCILMAGSDAIRGPGCGRARSACITCVAVL